jgi:hypothetical protein
MIRPQPARRHAEKKTVRPAAPVASVGALSGPAGDIVELQHTAGNAAVSRLLSDINTSSTGKFVGRLLVQRDPPRSAPASAKTPEQLLGDIQGHAMDALLPELRRLPAKVRTDEALGAKVGGPRLVMAMQAVSARRRGQAWTSFLAAKNADFQAWPPDQVVSILMFLGASQRSAKRQIAIASLGDIVSNTPGDLPLKSADRKRIIGTTATELPASYAQVNQMVRDVRQRVLVSLYMQKTQKGTWTKKGVAKGFSYPDRTGDGTKGVPARVNEAAVAFWGPVQAWPGNYFFNLSAAGKADAYSAIVALFKEQTDPHLRTLIHCDYLVSVIEMRAWAETIGVDKFNENVKLGKIPLVLKYDGFSDLTATLTLSNMPKSSTTGPETPLKMVSVSGESDLIIGDHVVFYNDPSYDALTEGDPDVWRLENAIVVDNKGGGLLYQGHGYSSPVPGSHLMDAMCNKYNLHVRRALDLIGAVKRAKTKKQRDDAKARLSTLYPNVRPKSGGGWEVSGPSDIAGHPVTRDLKLLTPATAPGLHAPSDGLIWVRRPDHAGP